MPQLEQKQDKFVIDTLNAWLGGIPADKAGSRADKTQAILNDILPKAGLTTPYTAEQCVINDMLLSKHADEHTCKAAWDFYIDYHKTPKDQA